MASPQCITFQSEYSLKSPFILWNTRMGSLLVGWQRLGVHSPWKLVIVVLWACRAMLGSRETDGSSVKLMKSHEAPMSGCLVGVLGSMDAQCENVL